MTKKFHIIVAMDLNRGIGKNNSIPWKIKEDMTYFKNITTCPNLFEVWNYYRMNDMAMLDGVKFTQPGVEINAVIMGRKTWDSLPAKFRPLPNRKNFVLSRTPQPNIPNCYTSIDEVMEVVSKDSSIQNVFVIGGAQIYAEALKHPALDIIFITHITETYDCDTFFPEFSGNFGLVSAPLDFENFKFKFSKYQK